MIDVEESAPDAGQRLARRIETAADRVLGTSEVGRALRTLCREHLQNRERILRRGDDRLIVAIVGATGQGKSWIAQQWAGERAAGQIASGNAAAQATERLTWIGPDRPERIDDAHEVYVPVARDDLPSLGVPYTLVDAPGATDHRPAITAIAARAISMASAVVLVIRRDQIRTRRLASLAEVSEGAIVVPVINLCRPGDDQIGTDTDILVEHLRRTAPRSLLTAPVLVDDFERAGQSEETIGRQAIESIVSQIAESMSAAGLGDADRRATRLAAADDRFLAAATHLIDERLPRLRDAVDRLHRESLRLPTEVAVGLTGGEDSIAVAIRSRLRISLVDRTPGFCFPYRTILSLLHLTGGAWERVVMSMAGSLPAMVGAVHAGVKNVSDLRRIEADLRDGLRQRADAAVENRITPLARHFRDEVHRIAAGVPTEPIEDADAGPLATLTGVEQLQTATGKSLEVAVDSSKMSRSAAVAIALVATIVFWALAAGPLAAMYRGYFDATGTSIFGWFSDAKTAADLEKFPRPDGSMLFAAVVLSVFPVAVIAMVTMAVAQSRRRVERATRRWHREHESRIKRLRDDGVLRLRWTDPLLAEAETLLSLREVG